MDVIQRSQENDQEVHWELYLWWLPENLSVMVGSLTKEICLRKTDKTSRSQRSNPCGEVTRVMCRLSSEEGWGIINMCIYERSSRQRAVRAAGSQGASCRETGLWLAAGCCMTSVMCRQPSEPREACFIRWFVLHPISTPWSKSVSCEWTMTRRNLCLAQLYNSIFRPTLLLFRMYVIC